MTKSKARKHRRTTGTSEAINVLSDAFVYSSYLTILILLLFRCQWFYKVWYSVTHGGDKTAFEIPHEQGLTNHFQIVTGDPSIILYLLISVAFLLLLVFGHQGLGSKAPKVLIAIRTVFFYSVLMITLQILFINLFASRPDDRSWYIFNSCLQRLDPSGKDAPTNLFCIDDPHYVTLGVSLLALLLLIDRNIVKGFAKLLNVKGFATPPIDR